MGKARTLETLTLGIGAAGAGAPLAFFGRRQFVGANSIWLLGCMTSWGVVFFLAVTLQTTLGLRPVTAGLLLTPIYLVMMAGSPLSGAIAGRFGGCRVIVAGLGVYTAGLWLLSHIHAGPRSPGTSLVPLAVFTAGMAMFTAPRAAAVLAVFGIPVALLTLPGGGPATGSRPGSGSGLSRPAR